MRLRLFLITVVGLIVVATYTFPLWGPYFMTQEVNEEFPLALSETDQAAFANLPQGVQQEFLAMNDDDPTMASDMASAQLNPTTIDSEPMPEGEPRILRRGSFIQLDAIHGASGTATLYQLPDDSYVLRLEDFRSTNGPDLYVILTRNPDPRDASAVGNYIELGRLRGNVGNQNYIPPPDLEVSAYNAVVIYCVRYGVVFSVATLQ